MGHYTVTGGEYCPRQMYQLGNCLVRLFIEKILYRGRRIYMENTFQTPLIEISNTQVAAFHYC